jgi:hypothetical protein
MNGTTSLFAGVGIGALAMYLLDPDRGRTRRAHLTQKAQRLGRMKAGRWEAATEDARNRLVGLWNEAAAKFKADDASDEAVEARIRAALGRSVTHPGAIEVTYANGTAELTGDILATELDGLLAAVRNVKGVREVRDHLDVHDEPGNVSALQGEGRIEAESRTMMPGPALGVGLLGVGLAIYGMTRKDAAGRAMSAAGALMAGKGMWDLEGKQIRELVGV